MYVIYDAAERSDHETRGRGSRHSCGRGGGGTRQSTTAKAAPVISPVSDKRSTFTSTVCIIHHIIHTNKHTHTQTLYSSDTTTSKDYLSDHPHPARPGPATRVFAHIIIITCRGKQILKTKRR